MAKVTIQDVAKEAGVSITTVSRVMNKNYPVRESTRVKVEAAIEKLEFKPNLLAKGLIQSSTKTIGILTPSLENLFFSEVIGGIDGIIGEKGYTTFLCHTEGDSAKERDMLTMLLNRQVDGVILLDPRKENVASGYFEKLSKDVPLLIINGHHQGVQCNYILNDGESGVLEALKYFAEQGITDVALLRGKKSYSYDIKEDVYRRFAAQQQWEPNVVSIRDGNDAHTVDQAKEAVVAMFDKGNRPGAILACNDWMAVGALNGAKAIGIEVPKDLRIIGFDNTIISQITEPKLSTVDQQMTRLGQLAAKRIYKMMTKDDSEKQKLFLETKLIIRES